jgi:Putative Ig domain
LLRRLSAVPTLACILAAIFLAGGCNRSSPVGAIALTLMPQTSVSLDEGNVYSFTILVANDSTNSGVVWQIYNDTTTTPFSCNIPSCGSLSNNTPFGVTYTAPTGLVATQKITLQATSAAIASVTVKATITVVLPMIVNTLSLPSGENGIAYRQTISVTGGVSPLNYSIASGSLPAGISVGAGGVIAGTPSSAGSSQFVLKISDSGSPPASVTQGYTITIAPPPPLAISTTSPLPEGVVGSEYSATIASTGGTPPLTWTLIGTLPAGLTFTTQVSTGSTTPYTTGEISGVPLSSGTTTFSVEVQDYSIPVQTATASFSLTINPGPPLAITTTSLPGGTTAIGYTAVVQASGGAAPLTWSSGPGLLPPGLALNPTDGTITGTPIRTGTSNFTISVTDSEVPAKSVSMNYSIAVATNSDVLQEYQLFNGPYAFLFSGYGKINSAVTFPEIIAGQMTVSGNGAITGGVEDVNSNGALTNLSFTGSYTIGTDGRGSMILTVTGPSGQQIIQTYQLALDAEGNAQFLEFDNTGSRGSGILLKQSSVAFSSGTFNGLYAFSFFGFDQNLKRTVVAGEFHANGSSALTDGEADQNDNGFMQNFAINGQFGSINPAGRGSASLFFSPNTQDYTVYLVSPSEAFFVATTTSTTNSSGQTTTTDSFPSGGIAYLQNGSPFSGISLAGNYVVSGTGTSASGNSSIFGSLMTLASTGASSGTDTPTAFDQNDGGTISSAVPAAGSYSVLPNGRVSFTGGTGRLGVAYIVNSNQAVFVGTDSEATLGSIDLQGGGPTFGTSSVQGQFTLKNPTSADMQATTLSGVPAADGAGNLTGEIDLVTGSDTQTLAASLAATYTVAPNGAGAITNGSGAGLPGGLAMFLISPERIRLVSTDPTDAHPTLFFLDY